MEQSLLRKLIDYCLRVYKRFIKFGIVGASGIVVDFGMVLFLNTLFNKTATTWIVRNFVQLAGYEVSVVSNYLLSFFWVWKYQHGDFFKKFLKYNLATTIAFLIRLFLFNLGMNIAHFFGQNNMLSYYIIYVASIGAVFIINFLIINHKVFTIKKQDEAND